MDRHVNNYFRKFSLDFFLFLAELIHKKELPNKNAVLNELTQEMTYVFLFCILKFIEFNSIVLDNVIVNINVFVQVIVIMKVN